MKDGVSFLTIFYPNYLLQCHQQPPGMTCGFYAVYHMLKAMELLSVKGDPEVCMCAAILSLCVLLSCLFILRYAFYAAILADFNFLFPNQTEFEVMTTPLDIPTLHHVRERIASFLVNDVISEKGEFHYKE